MGSEKLTQSIELRFWWDICSARDRGSRGFRDHLEPFSVWPFCKGFDSGSEALFFHLNNLVVSCRLGQKRWLIFSSAG